MSKTYSVKAIYGVSAVVIRIPVGKLTVNYDLKNNFFWFYALETFKINLSQFVWVHD